MSQAGRRAGGALLWPISIVAIFALCWSGVSRLFEASEPGLALLINPFNTEARVTQLVNMLETAEPDLEAAKSSATALIQRAPADARGYSLLGTVYEASGQAERAYELYLTALQHSKTEIHALLRLADRALRAGDARGGLYYVDLILRRWPGEVPQAFGIVVAAAGDRSGHEVLTETLGRLPPWRPGAIRELTKDPSGLRLVQELLTGEGPTEDPVRRGEIESTVAALAAAGAVRAAQALHLATLPAAERGRAGYVYDAAFEGNPGSGYFGWQAKSNGASEVTVPLAGGGLGVRFRDTPARLGNVAQRLALPAGSYRVEAEVSARTLEAPKQLYWRLTCLPDGQTLGQLTVPDGSYARKPIELELEVPPDNCAMQRLSLETDAKTDSWRDRYRGEATFHALRINRL